MNSSEEAFRAWFQKATGHLPFHYQTRLAMDEPLPNLLQIPTGLGKTAAAILAWLWRRRMAPDCVRFQTPRRLVYCLPMRVLVEQTRDAAILWLHRLGLLAGKVEVEGPEGEERVNAYTPSWDDPEKIAVSVLMGGEDGGKWDIYPERDAILIGTQDMLLSRALNRGYGMSRYRWPMHFGLLNNDCLWVVDEVQLMGSGLATTAQLQAFARQVGVLGSRPTIWASATLEPDWLRTVDIDPSKDIALALSLVESDRAIADVRRRLQATKFLQRTKAVMGEPEELAAEVVAAHRPGSRTLVVVNTVQRAVDLHAVLEKEGASARLVLVHSRFRPGDRRNAITALLAEPDAQGTIGVSTQVVEAGVDVSSRTLFTELAPWPSLVQRFGRCNRRGEYDDASVYLIGLPADEKQRAKLAPPYEAEELLAARDALSDLTQVGLACLPHIPMRFVHQHVVRRKDVLELFDTTPDLAGHDLDISRFIREVSDTDVQVFWRDIPKGEQPADDEPPPGREELCPVPIGHIRDLVKKKFDAWLWDELEGKWQPVTAMNPIYPGLVLMLQAADGRYSETEGWNAKAKRPVTVVPHGERAADRAYDAESMSENVWLSLSEHTDDVVRKAEELASAFGLDEPWNSLFLEAARWHDAGKAHPVFQRSMRGPEPSQAPPGILAKTALRKVHHERRGFRHELASGILALVDGKDDLVAYLAAAHHGKVRLSLRSLPIEKKPPEAERRFARGVWDGELIPEAELGGGVTLPESRIDLIVMELGESEVYGPSWMARMLALRDRRDLGPFRLALLEALIKAADERASMAETKKSKAGGSI